MRKSLKQCTQNTPSRIKNQSGFTLVEMTIVITIVGLIVVAAAQLIQQKREWDRVNNTKLALATAQQKISAFRNVNGRYPCPASLTHNVGDTIGLAPNEDVLHGVESNDSNDATPACTDTGTVTADSGISNARGYARATILDPATGAPEVFSYFNRETGVTYNGPAFIRIGALPFKNLNLSEEESLDGYGNRLIYAVTEHLAHKKTFDITTAGITVNNEQDVSAILDNNGNPARAHFFVFSTGENGAGGFSVNGGRLPCPAGTQESENCDWDRAGINAQIFKIAQSSEDGSGTQTFDVAVYATHEDISLWEKDPTDNGSNDIALKQTGNFGIGWDSSNNNGAADSPQETLQVDGTIIVRDDPDTDPADFDDDDTLRTEGLEGQITTESICNYDSDSPFCFSAEIIAGLIELNANGENIGGGMFCPPGTYMVAIKNGGPVCEDVNVVVTCPTGTVATGVNSDGTLSCSTPPKAECPSEQKTLCGNSALLTNSPHGTYQTISFDTSAGGERTQQYYCNDGIWEESGDADGDPCTCTPQTEPPATSSCASPDSSDGCGARFSGTRRTEGEYICPQGEWVTTTLEDNCVCLSTSKESESSCPTNSYNNGGKIFFINNHNCNANPPSCSGKQETSRTCGCVVETQTDTEQCSNVFGAAYSGTINRERRITCPNGADGAYAAGAWQNVGGRPDSAFCTCSDRTETDSSRSCPVSGEVGEYVVEITFKCDGTTTERVVTNTCAQPETGGCVWRLNGTGQSGPKPGLTSGVSQCDCLADAQTSKICGTNLGGGNFSRGSCTCQKVN